MRARWTVLGIASLMLALAPSTRANWTEAWHWGPGVIPVYLQQGSSANALLDGSPDWDSVTEGVLATWNAVLNGVALQPIRDATVPSGIPNDANDVIWSDDVYGDPFGDGVVALTLSVYTVPDNVLLEADVVFNRKVNWNSYRGNVRSAPGGGNLNDLRRVALHEFGHFIGLGHPDDHGETVVAIMNSHVGNIDALQTDDVNGAAAIYGPANPADAMQSRGPRFILRRPL